MATAVKAKKHQTFSEREAIADHEKHLAAQAVEDSQFLESNKERFAEIISKLKDPKNTDARDLVLPVNFTGSDFDSAWRDRCVLIVCEDAFKAQYEAGEAVEAALKSSELPIVRAHARRGLLTMMAQNRESEMLQRYAGNGVKRQNAYKTLTSPLQAFLVVVDNSEPGSRKRALYCNLAGSESGLEVISDLLRKGCSIEDALKTAFGALSV